MLSKPLFQISINFFFFLICIGFNTLQSQNLTNSPYSGFGVGDLNRLSMSRNFGMGGVGIALADKYAMNRINPASYSELWRFTLDVSGFYQSTQLKTNSATNSLETGGLQNIGMVLKKQKPFAIAIGLNPYSVVGYEFTQTRILPSVNDTVKYAYTSTRSGDGGLNDAYIGVSHQFFRNKLGIGANVRYIFGRLQTIWETNATNSKTPPYIENRFSMRGLGFQIGGIFSDTLRFLDSALVLRVGATTDILPALNTNNTSVIFTLGFDSQNNLTYYEDTLTRNLSQNISLPSQYGLGFSIGKANKYTIAGDFIYQDWTKFTYFQNQKLGTNTRFVLGMEWIPNITAFKKFFSRMAYRIGGSYENTYFNIDGQTVKNMTLTTGLGIPLSFTSLSRLNLGFEYSVRGSTSNGLIQENSAKIVFGVSFVEPWFNPRRYE